MRISDWSSDVCSADLLELSVGAGVSLVNCVLASRPAFLGLDIYGVMAVALVTAVCAGAINGFLVGYLRLSSLIATFATGAIWFGMALALIPQPGGEIPEELGEFFFLSWGPLPFAVRWEDGRFGKRG